MRFSISEIPDDLGVEDMPGGFSFLRLALESSTWEIRRGDPAHQNESNCIRHFVFEPECQRLFASCWRFFLPPLILTGLDMTLQHHSLSSGRSQLSMDQLAREFERGVRYYNEPSNRDFPFARILESDDVELPTDIWVWVIGYYTASDIHPPPRALVINLERFHDFLPVHFLDIKESDLQTRFPSTPSYFLPNRLKPVNFVPEYLK